MPNHFNAEVENDAPDVSGLDLKIDSSTQKLCEVSNSTSGNLRGIWYIIIIVSTLSFAEFWNTYPGNWSHERIKGIEKTILDLRKKQMTEVRAGDLHSADSLKLSHELDVLKDYLGLFRNATVQNINTVRIPILTNTFDINDLGIFAGFAFIILLLILYFILKRKVSNLQISLIAITKRYSDKSDEKLFEESLDHHVDKMKFLNAINLTRRKYHFDFLTMNEVFHVPQRPSSEVASSDKETFLDKSIENARRKIFYIPLLMSILLLVNKLAAFIWYDESLNLEGWENFKTNYILLFVISVAYIVVIYHLAGKCSKESEELEKLYSDFIKNKYKRL